ncbi:MAG: hypothetical protein GY839_07290 [candidate division Zixibacteria bacterium]|nr:hypothetical protein [candidate division Zixibacteria bacterium]
MDLNSIIRALAFVLAVVLIAELSWGTYKAVTVAKTEYGKAETVETLDSDIALAGTIDSLEANWNRRLKYRFIVDQDPLYIGRVIAGFSYGKAGFQEFDEGSAPRLSATVAVFNEKPMAIIKFMGKSHVLTEGDHFGDDNEYVVVDIQVKEVEIRKNGKSITLLNTPIGGAFAEKYQQGSYQSTEW